MSKEYKPDIESERRKWEFRYNNQKKTIRELEATIKKLRKELKDARSV